jgi:hypothetical protein
MAIKKTEPAPVEVIDIADPKPEPKAKAKAPAPAKAELTHDQMIVAKLCGLL